MSDSSAAEVAPNAVFEPMLHGPTMQWIVKQFSNSYSDVLCYIPGQGWRLCHSGVWELGADATHLPDIVTDFISEVFAYSAKIDKKDRDELHRLCKRVLDQPISRFLAFAKDYLTASSDSFDKSPTSLACLDGLIDLRSSNLRSLRASDMITKRVDYRLDRKARTPKFDALLLDLFGGDKAMLSYMQKVFGYCITGLNTEQKFFVFYGPPGTGKSTVLGIVDKVLQNGLVQQLPFHAFVSVSDRDKLQSRHGELLLRANAGRIAWASEGKEWQELDPNVLKSWTGGERQSVKGMYESERSVVVQSKIVLCTNHPPRYDDASGGMDRRMIVIPFNNRISDTKRVLGYDDLLVKEEGVGIFRWLVEGARRYFAEGLGDQPEAISKASTVAKGDNNSLAAFVSECVEEGGSVSASEVFNAYQAFCEERDMKPESVKKFSAYFPQQCSNILQIAAPEKRKLSAGMFWTGVSLKVEPSPMTTMERTMIVASSESTVARNVRSLVRIKWRFAHWWDIEYVEELEARCAHEGYDWISETEHLRIRQMIRKGMAWPVSYDKETMTVRPKVRLEYGRKKPVVE